MRHSKYMCYVFSVFSTAIGNYPYYPFIAPTINDGVWKFVKFLENRDAICEGAELHVIGTCEVHGQGNRCCNFENIQPYIVPQKVEIKNNLFSKIIILGMCYVSKLTKYLHTLEERRQYGKQGKK